MFKEKAHEDLSAGSALCSSRRKSSLGHCDHGPRACASGAERRLQGGDEQGPWGHGGQGRFSSGDCARTRVPTDSVLCHHQ